MFSDGKKWPDFEYHGGKWLKYDRFGFNSSHPSLGSTLIVCCIELTSSGTFRSFPRCLKMVIFPLEFPLKTKCLQNLSYGSIIVKIVLWAHFTITHAVLCKASQPICWTNLFWDTLIYITDIWYQQLSAMPTKLPPSYLPTCPIGDTNPYLVGLFGMVRSRFGPAFLLFSNSIVY